MTHNREFGSLMFARVLAFMGVLLALATTMELVAFAQEHSSGQTNPSLPTLTRGVFPAGVSAERGRMTGDGQKLGAGPMDGDGPLLFPVVTYSTGGQLAYAIAAADLNGDGNVDMIVANYGGEKNGDGSVGVLLGNGDGTFRTAVAYDSGGGGPYGLAIGDLNHDGIPDIVVENQGCAQTQGDCIGVLLGNGDGTFQPAKVYEHGGFGTFTPNVNNPTLTIVDINGDDKPDLVVVNNTDINQGDGAIGVLLGNGDGTFQPFVDYDSGGFPATAAQLRDVNGDGRLDVVVLNCGPSGSTNCGQGTMGVLLGNGDGTFGSVQLYARDDNSTFESPIMVADLNGDGKPDVLVGNDCTLVTGSCPTSGSADVFIGNGDGTFEAPVRYALDGIYVSSIQVADVNHDGKPDLIVGDYGVGILLGNGNGTFQPEKEYSTGATELIVSDINGDGSADVVASGFGYGVTLLIGDGTGAFTVSPVFAPGGFPLNQTILADVNNDGIPDVLTVNWCASVRTCKVGKAEVGTAGVLINNAGPHAPTSTALSSSKNPVELKKMVTLTATVATESGRVATGTVTFLDGNSTVGTVSLGNGQAALKTKFKQPGSHAVTAMYSGDADNAPSTSAVLSEQVTAPTKTKVVTSGSPSQVGQPVTFTATVSSKFGSVPNGEVVSFYDKTTLLGTTPLSGGVASLTTSSLSVGKHPIKAIYSGDTTLESSEGTVSQVVEQ